MKIFRFMSIDEFRNFLKGETIEGKFVKGKACFLEGDIRAREKEASVKQLTDLTSLNFKSTDFDGQMKELNELISPVFENGDFEGQLKQMEHLTPKDFMQKVRKDVTADVLVEFETKKAFEQEFEKVIMSYKNYLIEEIQSNGYSMDTLECVSYKIDLINGFKNGVGVDTIKENKFQGIEQTLEELDNAEKFMKKEKIENLKSEKTITPRSISKDTQEIGLKEINSTTQEIKNKFLEKQNFIEDIEIDEKE